MSKNSHKLYVPLELWAVLEEDTSSLPGKRVTDYALDCLRRGRNHTNGGVAPKPVSTSQKPVEGLEEIGGYVLLMDDGKARWIGADGTEQYRDALWLYLGLHGLQEKYKPLFVKEKIKKITEELYTLSESLSQVDLNRRRGYDPYA
jgi:hypothetical protein